jgi:hypothetical protein
MILSAIQVSLIRTSDPAISPSHQVSQMMPVLFKTVTDRLWSGVDSRNVHFTTIYKLLEQ